MRGNRPEGLIRINTPEIGKAGNLRRIFITGTAGFIGFSQLGRVQVGDEQVEVFFPGASHTLDNVVVYFHNRRLLYGGCMIKAAAARTPGFTADADMDAWPRSVQKVLDHFPQARLVVPGHGHCGDLGLLQHTIEICEGHR